MALPKSIIGIGGVTRQVDNTGNILGLDGGYKVNENGDVTQTGNAFGYLDPTGKVVAGQRPSSGVTGQATAPTMPTPSTPATPTPLLSATPKSITGISGIVRNLDPSGYALDDTGARMIANGGPIRISNGIAYAGSTPWKSVDATGSLIDFTQSQLAAQNTPATQQVDISKIPQAVGGTAVAGQYQVDPTKTSQGLYDAYAQKDTLAKQRARAVALEQGNTRGLLNTTMTEGAAQAASDAVDMQSANIDSGYYQQAGTTNAQNTTSANISTAGNQTQASGINANTGAQGLLANAKASNDASTVGMQEASANWRADLSATSQANVAQMNITAQASMSSLDRASRERLGQLDADSRAAVNQATIAANATLAQKGIDASKNAAFLSQQASAMDTYARAVSLINSNADTSTEIKNAGIQAAKDIMKSTIQVAAKLASITIDPSLWAV